MSDRTFLDEITIRSIGVIDQATVELSQGLTVLTGETGAGKTMILTALNLILGGKSDGALVRKGSERLLVSARFSIPRDLSTGFEDVGVPIEDGELNITRLVGSDGKSKASANGSSVTAGTLSSISELLVEVHAQAANIHISKSTKQRELLDRYAGEDFRTALHIYRGCLDSYQSLKSRIAALKISFEKKEEELGELREFVAAISKLKLKRGESAQILNQIQRLSSVEELRIASSSASQMIEEEESGALHKIASARRFLESARGKDPALEEIYSQLSESFYLLSDANSSITSYMHSLEADPLHLDFLNSRKAQISALVKKYGGTASPDAECEGLIDRYEASGSAIADIEGGDNRFIELGAELVTSKKNLVSAAKKITELRCSAALALNVAVTKEVQALSMPHTSFCARVESANYEALRESDFTSNGCDEVAMFISAHKDAPFIALAKGASGGEMSRVMLALEVVIAETHPVGTYIFDEVDAGIGGKAAIEVGRRLHALSCHAQVIVVTHLPQVAAWADSHFVVTKDINGVVSQSDVRKVEGEDRIQEIARMLAGIESSLSAREHAAELLALKV